MDNGTRLDYIKDLQQELRHVRNEQKRWERIARKAFEMHPACLPGCAKACMCSCGYELYFALIRDELKND